MVFNIEQLENRQQKNQSLAIHKSSIHVLLYTKYYMYNKCILFTLFRTFSQSNIQKFSIFLYTSLVFIWKYKYTSKRDIENRKKTLKSKFTGDEYVYMCDVHVNSSLPWLGESLLLNSGLQIAFLEGRP